jgi:AAA domain, putative AbiEii toxin, Type IV TA system
MPNTAKGDLGAARPGIAKRFILMDILTHSSFGEGMRMSEQQPEQGIRLRSLTIRNFKAFKDFTIKFPPPRMKDDPDILVMGSSNGLGKTSILEACSLLYLATIPEENYLNRKRYPRVVVDLPDLLIRSGAEEASIEGTFVTTDNVNIPGRLTLYRSGRMEADRDSREHLSEESKFRPPPVNPSSNEEAVANLFLALLGVSSDPLLLPYLLYFHSYRKIPEGRLELGQLAAGTPLTTFKFEVIRALMSREGLFEDFDAVEAKEVLEILDELMKQYAQVAIGKLKLSSEGTIDFRVISGDGDNSSSYSFDSLSSGQKEIISTLFLIARYGQRFPGIVLIDEPELHLNIEWHRSLIRNMCRSAPGNQYIIATHSPDIFEAVDKDRRILLVPEKEEL